MKKLAAVLLTLYFSALNPFTGYAFEPGAPVISAKAAIVIEPMTGRVLFEQNADDRLPIASTTKILTALMALEQPDIDAVFTVDETAIMVEGSSMGLLKGDKVTLRALAEGMLLASGNDGANAAAVRIAGSIPDFVGMMNDRAFEMGLFNTSFETPSGLDGELHYSSARDLAAITVEAMKNDEFVSICSQYRIRTSYGNPPYDRWLTNHNRLLNSYPGSLGVKTGYTRKAGRCLVSAVRREGVTLICVTLCCPSDWNAHKSLYDYCFNNLKVEDLSANIPAIRVPVAGGEKSHVAALKCDRAQIPVPVSGADISYVISTGPFVYAPVKKGQYLGEIRIMLDGEQVYCITLAAGSDVALLHEYKEKKSLFDWIKSLFGLEVKDG